MSSINQNPRPWIIRLVFLILALILIGRLFEMQILDNKYKIMANDQAIIKKTIFPPRGIILDRNGVSIVTNTLTYDLAVTPAKIEDFDTAAFCRLMNMTSKQFSEEIKKIVVRNGPVRPSVFSSYLNETENARLQENIYRFPGFELRAHYSRSYPAGIAPHVVGYIHEISKGMLKTPRYRSYQSGDYVGISGLESVYEEELRGQRGVSFIVRDVLNRPRQEYMNGELDTPAIAGKTLKLYLDAKLQKLGETLMQNKIGSIVAIDPKTGGILAMVSSPSYDPALLSGGDFSKNYSQLSQKFTRPLFNYAIQAQYPPGSTFKPVDAVIALDLGVITPQFGYPCRGGYYACGRRIGCTETWAGHAADLELALAWSCNSYFCDVFRRIVDAKQWNGGVHEGLQKWHDYLYSFGLGHPLGVDITGEYGGNIPDSAYYNSVYGNYWNSCNMVTDGIGQGEVTETPLQMANAVTMIANRGYYYTPHFVQSIGGNPKDPALAKYLIKRQVTHIPYSVFTPVIQGMEDVVKTGTGRIAQLPGIAVCGKTGTAENYGIINGQRVKLDNHSVFVCFAPKDDPKIVIATVVQNAGYGASWAAPIASLIMEQYLTDTIKRTALMERMQKANTIKNYIRVIDSFQRQKDYMHYVLKTANKRTKDSIRRQRDTVLVKQILHDYYKIKTPKTSYFKAIQHEE